MLASRSHWTHIPPSDHFGELTSPGATGGYSEYENQSISHRGHENYYSETSSSHNTSKSRYSKIMPSKSRHNSTVDGDYEWDEPEQDHKKKGSRSKLPAEDKLIKRRDQNRVSQRAFRQRKEKHTKELEAKVEELENLLETASHENSIVTSQMSRMEEELCYYRRLLFAGANGQGIGISPPASETSAKSSYTTNYTSNSTYPTTYSPIPATAPLATSYNSPRSTGSSSATSSPALTNIPGDFSSTGGVESFWGYDVPQTPAYMQFNTSGAPVNSWQGQDDGW